ncbi:MAG: hypothetical protein V1874_13245 [Spirochaetota bacterium]
MKKNNIIFLIISLTILMITFSCSSSDDDSSSQSQSGGHEAELEGNWWITSTYSDGVSFDGKGGGYDLSYENSVYCIDADDPITYRFDGTTLSVDESGHSYSGTWTFIDNDTATFVLQGTPLTAVRVTVAGNCN